MSFLTGKLSSSHAASTSPAPGRSVRPRFCGGAELKMTRAALSATKHSLTFQPSSPSGNCKALFSTNTTAASQRKTGDMAAVVPERMKAASPDIHRLAVRAAQLQKFRPIVSYWCMLICPSLWKMYSDMTIRRILHSPTHPLQKPPHRRRRMRPVCRTVDGRAGTV